MTRFDCDAEANGTRYGPVRKPSVSVGTGEDLAGELEESGGGVGGDDDDVAPVTVGSADGATVRGGEGGAAEAIVAAFEVGGRRCFGAKNVDSFIDR